MEDQLHFAKILSHSSREFLISDNYLTYTSEESLRYNVIFVVGKDTSRFRRFMKTYSPIMARKPKIAVTKDTSPARRAKILEAGFDDVFTTAMPVDEAQARIQAMLRRVRLASRHDGIGELLDVQLRNIVSTPLQPREIRLMRKLLSSQGSVVRTHELASVTNDAVQSISPASLRVAISNLRGKLQKHVRIRSHGLDGYSLVIMSPARIVQESFQKQQGKGKNEGLLPEA